MHIANPIYDVSFINIPGNLCFIRTDPDRLHFMVATSTLVYNDYTYASRLIPFLTDIHD
ncbi:MAG: hypothetical protein LBK65_06065 [Tannerellaceae bacterium]|nr:hypothetical protein [Tannerellaceae bacterium]